MKRLVAIILLAGLTPAPSSRAADPLPGTLVPTSPSVPAPVLEKGALVVPASGVSRVVPPIRERAATVPVQPTATSQPMPLPTGYQPPAAGGCEAGGCAAGDCGAARARGSCIARIKAWLCYQPTTGKTLPIFRPAPYVGPITGTFRCTSTAGACGAGNGCTTASGCAGGNGCAASGDAARTGLAAKLSGLMGGRGCRGGCVPPSDDAFPGYHFAGSRTPAAGVAPLAPPAGYAGSPPTLQPTQPTPVSAQPGEPQSRLASPPAAGPTVMPTAAQSLQPKDKSSTSLVRWASWTGR